MSKLATSSLLSSRLIRNLLAVVGTLVLTFIVFRGVAAFNDALRLYGSLPVVAPTVYSCPQGYALVTIANTTQQECIPAPSASKGVVAVGLYQPEAKKTEPSQPAAAKTPAQKPAAPKPTTPP